MKNLTSRKIEMYLDYIELYEPNYGVDNYSVLYIDRNYLNRMITLTQTTCEDVETFLTCYFGLIYETKIKEIIKEDRTKFD